MSITATFTHTIEDGLEQYAFPSDLHPQQMHYIGRYAGDSWGIDIVQIERSMSQDETKTLMHEIEALLAFADNLNRPDLHRSTEPGQPAFEEVV